MKNDLKKKMYIADKIVNQDLFSIKNTLKE